MKRTLSLITVALVVLSSLTAMAQTNFVPPLERGGDTLHIEMGKTIRIPAV